MMFQFTHPGGVRPLTCEDDLFLFRFQFTHPGGVRLYIGDEAICSPWFQFTHPGGVRRRSASRALWQDFSFNSRTREGCDLDGYLMLGYGVVVSIHAPGRGATFVA